MNEQKQVFYRAEYDFINSLLIYSPNSMKDFKCKLMGFFSVIQNLPMILFYVRNNMDICPLHKQFIVCFYRFLMVYT